MFIRNARQSQKGTFKMYAVLTNMTVCREPNGQDEVLMIYHCRANELEEVIGLDLVVYYALYNHAPLRLQTFKDREWATSRTRQLLSEFVGSITERSDVVRFKDYGGKYQGLEEVQLRLPLSERLLTPTEQNDCLAHWGRLKWVNELGWN